MGEAWGKPAGPQRGGAPKSPARMGCGCPVPKPGWVLLSLWPPSRGALQWGKVAAVLQEPLSPLCSRRYPWVKRSLLLLLLLLLLAAAAYGELARLDPFP